LNAQQTLGMGLEASFQERQQLISSNVSKNELMNSNQTADFLRNSSAMMSVGAGLV
jgi:hypothetical protein